jgi:hypothetical protein
MQPDIARTPLDLPAAASTAALSLRPATKTVFVLSIAQEPSGVRTYWR